MAAWTRDGGMCPLQGKVSETVIEGLRVQANDIRLSPLVILVTVAAFVSRDISPFPMSPALKRDIRGDLLMAVQAAAGLCFLGE